MRNILSDIVNKSVIRDSLIRVVSRYIESASKAKIDHLMLKYKLDQEVMDSILDTDPTPNGEYLEWIIGRLRNHKLRLPEDSGILKPALKNFHELKNRRVFKDSRDIRTYKSPGDLYKTLEKYKEKGDETSDITKRLEKAGDGFSVAVRGPDYVWYKITKPEAACALGSGTSWCTVHRKYSEHYLADGPLYMLYKNGKPVAQVHFESEQFMDMYDNELYKSIGNITRFKVAQYLTELNHLASATLEYLPSEYLHALSADNPKLLRIVKTEPDLAYEYAKEVVGGRWPEGEDIIATDPAKSILYAGNVLDDRFPKGEDTILKSLSGGWMGAYARNVFEGGNWGDAERVLLEAGNVDEVFNYLAKLGKDFPAPILEDLIAEDRGGAIWYFKEFLDKDISMVSSKKLRDLLVSMVKE